MWMIVGLGNPGTKYTLTRHNVGFMALDYFVKAMGATAAPTKIEHKAITTQFKVDDETLLLVKPQTYMNLSGEAVGELVRYYKIPLEKIIVAHDELDHAFGVQKVKVRGGDGGHNGLTSLIEHLGSNEFIRLRIGVGRPTQSGFDVAKYVLQNFSKDEQVQLVDILNKSVDIIESLIFEGPLKTMNKFN